MGAFGSGVASRQRRAGESCAAGEENDGRAGGQRPCQSLLTKIEGDSDVILPVRGELLPSLFVQRRERRGNAAAENENVGLNEPKYPGRCVLLNGIEREDPDTRESECELAQRLLAASDTKHSRSVPDAGFDDKPTHTATATDNDHIFADQ